MTDDQSPEFDECPPRLSMLLENLELSTHNYRNLSQIEIAQWAEKTGHPYAKGFRILAEEQKFPKPSGKASRYVFDRLRVPAEGAANYEIYIPENGTTYFDEAASFENVYIQAAKALSATEEPNPSKPESQWEVDILDGPTWEAVLRRTRGELVGLLRKRTRPTTRQGGGAFTNRDLRLQVAAVYGIQVGDMPEEDEVSPPRDEAKDPKEVFSVTVTGSNTDHIRWHVGVTDIEPGEGHILIESPKGRFIYPYRNVFEIAITENGK